MFLFSSTVTVLFAEAWTELKNLHNVMLYSFVVHASNYNKWFDHVKLLYV